MKSRQSGLCSLLLDLRLTKMEAGWGCRQTKLSMVDWCQWKTWDSSVCADVLCMPSFWICHSVVTIPSFFLLGFVVLSFHLTCLALAPLEDSYALDLRAASIASVQYFCVSRWNFKSSEKVISRRNWLALETSSGVRSKRTLISFITSLAFFVWRYPCFLSFKDIFRKIHCKCLIWRILEINCLVQSFPSK